MAFGHFSFAMAWPGAMYIGTLLVGLGYGAHWAIVPAAASELFGLKNFGALYNFLTVANPAGSLVFSGIIASGIYDSEAEKQAHQHHNSTLLAMPGRLLAMASDATQPLKCEGAICFFLSSLIMSGFCIVAAVLSLILIYRTKIVYANLYGNPRTWRISSVKTQKETKFINVINAYTTISDFHPKSCWFVGEQKGEVLLSSFCFWEAFLRYHKLMKLSVATERTIVVQYLEVSTCTGARWRCVLLFNFCCVKTLKIACIHVQIALLCQGGTLFFPVCWYIMKCFSYEGENKREKSWSSAWGFLQVQFMIIDIARGYWHVFTEKQKKTLHHLNLIFWTVSAGCNLAL